jgi:hypothetical protein
VLVSDETLRKVGPSMNEAIARMEIITPQAAAAMAAKRASSSPS